jgi:serine/threonine protein kinase
MPSLSLTGTSPFYGRNYHEVLRKNKEGVVKFDDKHWEPLSPQARDLVSKLVAINPAERLTAQQALAHPWFNMDHSEAAVLSTAQENMAKYNAANRFNLEKIKPEFSMLSCTPLLNGRASPGDRSPAPSADKGRWAYVGVSPMLHPAKLNPGEEEKKVLFVVPAIEPERRLGGPTPSTQENRPRTEALVVCSKARR